LTAPTESDQPPMIGSDAWAAENPWHPRITPWLVYLLLLTVALSARQWQEWTYVPIKLLQTAVVIYLVWRWRTLLPELTWRVHWMVLPVSLALTGGWIYLNALMLWLFPALANGEPSYFANLYNQDVGLFWLAAIAHLIAMCVAVPIVEELFNRSLLLRSLHRPRVTAIGILQVLVDVPLIGDLLVRTRLGKMAVEQPPVLARQFAATRLGQLSVFGVAASTTVFMLVHATVDWPGALLCGVTWCLLLHRTRHLGLGPVIWSHALVNLLLWLYVVSRGAWQFM
jgi:hypothetical protein